MKKHRYKVSFSITTIIYASLFLTYVVMMGQHFIVSQKEKDITINLALSQFIPEVIEQPPEPIEEPEVEEEVEPEPEPEIVEPEPIPEPVVEEKPVIEPVIVKKVEKKPEPKKVVKKKKVKKKKIAKKKIVKKSKKAKRKKARKSSSRRATSRRVDPNKKSRFLSKIRAKINRAKSYPRIAQKRGMQGSVKVRFTILKNGRVGHISVSGPKVFQSSAKRAVKKHSQLIQKTHHYLYQHQ